VTFGAGAFWIVDDRGLVRLEPVDNSASVVYAQGGGVAVRAGAAWVGDRFPPSFRGNGRPGDVARIDLADTATQAVVPAADPVAVSVGAGAVWVANRQSRSVERIDPKTNKPTATIRIGNTPTALTASAKAVWIVAS
jgi:YVTN family beta-propeller protein